jgi:hypothetical protein
MKSKSNEKILAELQNSFDTTQLLDLVDNIDQIRARICEPDAIRAELLNLHGTAHAVLNEGSASIPEDLWEVADELSMELSDWADKLEAGSRLLDQLAALVPDELEEDEG